MSRKFLFASAVAFLGAVNLNTPVQAADVDVSATVVSACTIVGGSLGFGSYVAGQTTAKNAQTDITYDCASGLDVTLNLSAGSSPIGTARSMLSPTTGENLTYQLYQDTGRLTIWGSGASGVNINPTPGGGVETHTIFGQIPANLTVNPATNYADVVVFDLAVN